IDKVFSQGKYQHLALSSYVDALETLYPDGEMNVESYLNSLFLISFMNDDPLVNYLDYQYQIMKIDVKTNFISSNLVQKDIENLEKDLRKKLKENSLKLVMAGDVLNGIKVNNY